ncbi:MAG: response regulator [Deltaproteobacteria bacterium]|nr:response regulator [Deltaproteobacteria bacterium]
MDPPQPPLNILLVDDDEVDAITVKRAFSKAKLPYHLTVVRNGIEALELLRGGTFAAERRLVLLDIHMPRMNGIEFLREVRADPKLQKLTIVMMTTSSEESDRIEAYQLNVAGYVIKPVTFQALETIVATLSSYWKLMQFP